MEVHAEVITINNPSATDGGETMTIKPSSLEVEPTGAASNGNVIPESLLSLAKDARYIQQCQILLEQVWGAILLRRQSSPSEQSVLKRRTWLLSYLLYILFIVAPSGRSLGMQICGIKFDDGSTGAGGGSTTKRLRFVVNLLMTALAGFGLEYCATMSWDNDGSDNEESTRAATTIHQESLRGSDRRQMHEHLRRQMMERSRGVPIMMRATSDEATVVHSNQQTRAEHRTRGLSSTSTLGQTSSLSHRVRSVLRRMSKSFLDASFLSEGPHVITDDSDGEGSDSSNAYFSVARWLIRFHLAQYLVTGRYPTLVHRFLGLQTKRDDIATSSKNSTSATILFQPNASRAIAALIILQASTSLIRGTSNRLAAVVANYLASHSSSAHPNESEPGVVSTQAQLDTAMSKCFNYPSNITYTNEVHSSPMGAMLSTTADSLDRSSSSSMSGTVCAICRTDRKHPAAPSSCGHVCCWNCLIQWVSTVRPECPLCRAPCRPQEVIALHHYEPVSSSVDDA